MALTIYRGDVVVCVSHGDYGKPRPAVIVQSDLFNPTHGSIVVCPITSHIVDTPMFRIRLDASKQNGIKVESQIMIDKVMAIKREKIRKKIGKLAKSDVSKLDLALKLWLNV